MPSLPLLFYNCLDEVSFFIICKIDPISYYPTKLAFVISSRLEGLCVWFTPDGCYPSVVADKEIGQKLIRSEALKAP